MKGYNFSHYMYANANDNIIVERVVRVNSKAESTRRYESNRDHQYLNNMLP